MTLDEEFEECERKLAEIGTPFYRFKTSDFVKAKDFAEAKRIMIAKIEAEVEDEKEWCPCTCLGLSHRFGCPVQAASGIPF